MNHLESASVQRQEKYRLFKYLRFKQAVLVLMLSVGLAWLFGWVSGSLDQPVLSAALMAGLIGQALALVAYSAILHKGALAGLGLVELGIGWLMWPLQRHSEALWLWLVALFIGLGALTLGLSEPNRQSQPGALTKALLFWLTGLVIWLAAWLGLAVMSSTLYPLKTDVASRAARSVLDEQRPSRLVDLEVRSVVNLTGRLYLVRLDQAVWIFDRTGRPLQGDGTNGECRLPIDWTRAYRHEAPRWCAYVWSSPLFHSDYQTIPNGA